MDKESKRSCCETTQFNKNYVGDVVGKKSLLRLGWSVNQSLFGVGFVLPWHGKVNPIWMYLLRGGFRGQDNGAAFLCWSVLWRLLSSAKNRADDLGGIFDLH
jgi:hypothetical protein